MLLMLMLWVWLLLLLLMLFDAIVALAALVFGVVDVGVVVGCWWYCYGGAVALVVVDGAAVVVGEVVGVVVGVVVDCC